MTDAYDVIVVGAGPAGSTAAIAARRAGARVLLLDKADFPRDKACGDGVAPHALDVLESLGVTGVADGYKPVLGLKLETPHSEAGGGLIRPNHTIPRYVFDARLVEAAVAAGAELRRHTVRTIAQADDGWCSTTPCARRWSSARTAPARSCGARSGTRPTATGTWRWRSAGT